MNLQPYLDFATSLAYRAGKITLGHFNTGVHVNTKENNDPVTIADHQAENFILCIDPFLDISALGLAWKVTLVGTH
jgi:3'-phosphoadenosine 5'-phosphosulfate (PAPS) 3'-phosphatase